jgi:hypothetical protein
VSRAQLLVVLVLWSYPATCLAGIERFAVIVGNDRGVATDGPLQYAAADATRIYEVLRDLGGFQPVNMVLLHDESADTLRRTLITVNDRIRAAISVPDTQAMLFVYYSGHADADDLHLGATRFPIAEFAQLARGSAASFRLVVLDACRSGALTRVKGGRIRAPFALPDERQLGDGVAFLTASSASEDAQESDELRGSFFTHAFVSGLLGAADHDGDGAIALDEAYHYAYQATLRTTSRTRSGSQHPTYRYDFRGEGNVVLTRPEYYAKQRAQLNFPAGMTFLVMRDDAEGNVVAELGERALTRTLSLRPGHYFVRARAADVLYEGGLQAVAGAITPVDLTTMTRIQYARLVRKGQGDTTLAHALELGARLRTLMPNADTLCAGGFIGYGLDFAQLGARLRIGACTSGFEHGSLRATTNAYDAEARIYRTWDLSALFVELGLGAGLSLFTQRFSGVAEAPPRNSLAPFLVLGASTGIDLPHGLYTSVDLSGETHFLRLRRTDISNAETVVSFALRTSLAVGKHF